MTMNKCAIVLPDQNEATLSFKNYYQKEKIAFVVYADSECLLNPVTSDDSTPLKAYQSHKLMCIGYYVCCSYDDSLSRYRSYFGLDGAAWFAREMKNLAIEVEKVRDCITYFYILNVFKCFFSICRFPKT